MIRQTFPGALRAVGERQFKFIGATSRLARDGHILLPSGINLDNYKKNPIILAFHDPTRPVARAISIAVIDGELRGTGQFAPEGTSAAADEAYGLVRSNILNSMSIGFDIISAEPLDPKKGSRAGLRITASDCLELSLVAVGADVGATITERSHTRSMAMQKHLARIEELVDTAARVHHDLGRAIDRGDDLAVDRHHVRLGRCLRDCQRTFKSIHEQAALADLQANQFEQNSGGLGKGTSDSTSGGRAVPPTLSARLGTVLQLQRPYVPDGSAVGVATVRELELARAQAHTNAVARAGAFRRPPTRAERQEDLRRLTRD